MPHAPIPNAMVTGKLFLCRIIFQWSQDLLLPVQLSIEFLY